SNRKSRTSAAIRVGKVRASNSVMGPTPLLPASNADQVDSRSRPVGVTIPIPVTTTRRMETILSVWPSLGGRRSRELGPVIVLSRAAPDHHRGRLAVGCQVGVYKHQIASRTRRLQH